MLAFRTVRNRKYAQYLSARIQKGMFDRMNYSKKNVRRKKKSARSNSKRWGKKMAVNFFKVFLLFALAVGILGVSLGLGLFKGILDSAPEMIDLDDITPKGISSFVYDNQGNQIAKLTAAGSNRIPVTYDQVPEDLANAFVAIEDERFYEHNGIDIQGILRAGFVGITSGNFSEGASTITQQLIKNNVLTSWTSETTFLESLKRKIQEQYLALELEKNLTETYGRDEAKKLILQNYMNTINLGQNTLGVQAASRRYFAKNVWDLTLSESAVIAGITQNPSRYNPINHPDNNAERRQKVLDNMLEQGYITQAEYDEALADDVYSRIKVVNEDMESDTTVNSYYVDAVTEQVEEDLIEAGYTETQAFNLLYSSGLSIYSAMDPDIQAIVDEVCMDESMYPDNTQWYLDYALTIQKANGEQENHSKEMFRSYVRETSNPSFDLLYDSQDEAYAAIEEYKAAHVEEGDEILGERISLTPQPQISLTIMDQSTGNVVAMMGGRGPKEGNRTLNRATSSTRQPGSTFKIPAVYAPALDSAGYTLATAMMDEPFNYSDGKPVKNSYSGYKGNMSIRDGIIQSCNILAVKTLTQITPQLGYDYLLKFGFTTLEEGREINGEFHSDIVQSLALGGITNGVTNLELNAAYAAIANHGYYNEPKLYSKVVDNDGNVLLDNTQTASTPIIKETTAFLLTDAMVDVVTSGTGTRANFGNMSIAGKTGTTSDYNDSWFAGFTPYYTCTTWAGYDNNAKLKSGAQRSLTRDLWREVMSRIHENLENKAFEVPAGIAAVTVCSKSGKLPISGLCDATLKTEYFDQSTVPTQSCDVHYQGNVCAYSALPATDLCPFKVPGVLELEPSGLPSTPAVTPSINGENTQTTASTIQQCPHNAEFFANPAAQAVIAQQEQELEARNNQGSYADQLAALQTQLQQATAAKQAADEQYASATDEATRNSALQASQAAQAQIDDLNNQIAALEAAQAASQTTTPVPAE